MLRVVFVVLALAACTMLVACADSTVEIARAEIPRDTSSQSSPSQVNTLVNSSSAFAFDLYQQLVSDQADNLVFSPYSLTLALAMASAGARGETAGQMSTVLHASQPPDEFHAAFNTLNLHLTEVAEKSPDGLQLHIANGFWLQKGLHIEPAFLNVLAQNYGAEIHLANFKGAPDASRLKINQWVSEQTNEHIKDLLPEGSVAKETRMLLANTIYFNGKWWAPFIPEMTEQGSFDLLSGDHVNVPMMSHPGFYGLYAEGENWQALQLPYQGQDAAMLIILPAEGHFADVEASLHGSRFAEILSDLSEATIQELIVPRFHFESQSNMRDVLRQIGLELPFDTSADFSGITRDEPVYLSTLIHRAGISVGELGTEAYAVSVEGWEMAAEPPEHPIYFIADRPFIFVIYDTTTNTVLFLGRVTNPASQ